MWKRLAITKALIDNRKKLLSTNISPTCAHNMVNIGPLTAEICWRVLGTAANFNGFRLLAAFLHGTVVVGVSQTLRRWTEGATYIWQVGHHVVHRPTFLVLLLCVYLFFFAYSQRTQIRCLPYFHTWCGRSANLERMSEMCCTSTTNLGNLSPFWGS